MAVDLSDLVDYLRAAITPLTTNTFEDVTDDTLTLRLQNGFWEAVLAGAIEGYTETDGIVTPLTGTTDLSEELQHVVVLFAEIASITAEIRNTQSVFRAKAGPVEYETQQSANVQRDLLAELKYRRDLVLTRLSDLGTVEPAYLDMYAARTDAIISGSLVYPGLEFN